MPIFKRLQAHIDAALAEPKQGPTAPPEEDFAGESRVEVSAPKRVRR